MEAFSQEEREEIYKQLDCPIYQKSQFITPNYVPLTQGLFFEFQNQPGATVGDHKPLYNLVDNDRNGCISLKKRYLELEDTTEYLFADLFFYNYRTWQRLYNNAFFTKHIDTWREELEMKLKCKALSVIRNIAINGESKAALPAAKYLAEKGWEKNKSGRGRPSKNEIERAARDEVNKSNRLLQDAERIGLRPVS